MVTTAPRYILPAMLLLPVLAACSSGRDATEMTVGGESREFSEQDKIAARALSISDSRTVSAGSPYTQALLCRNAMEVLGESFAQSGALSEQQMQGVGQAKAYFDGQLHELVGAEGKSPDDIGPDLEQVAQDNQDAAANARIAIACLERLRETV